ncbi:MAG: NAD(P)/FAD-dependent oxidoreductase [Nitriliruptorales bacterium]
MTLVGRRRCVVVGAGIAGLLAATRLREHGVAVVVLDEHDRPGGRMSTRHHRGGVWDHGAQYFTARDPAFQHLCAAWQAAGVTTTWFRGLPPPDTPDLPPDDPRRDEPHHCGTRGMRSVPEHLAAPLDVRCRSRVARLTATRSGWRVRALTWGDGEADFDADAVLVTAPVPRSLTLLEGEMGSLPGVIRNELPGLSYHPTLAVLALLEAPSELPEPGGYHGDGDPLDWIADNHQKGISPTPSITLHAGELFSRQHFEDDPDEWAPELLEAARPLLGAPVTAWWTARWPHATPVETYPERTVVIDSPGLVAFAGDAFAGPRVEGAALSGLAAAEELVARLRVVQG